MLGTGVRYPARRLARCRPRYRGILQHPKASYATSISTFDPAAAHQISSLKNGARVATEALPGPFAGVGVYVDAGSRYENEDLRGVSHIMDRLAFKSTAKRSADNMLETIESLGGNIHCVSSRETLMYQAASFNAATSTTLGLLAETIRDPLITAEEVQQQLETADYEIREIWSKPEAILPELVHVAAYKGNTLGNPLLCPAERLPYINRDTIDRYRAAFFQPERLVIAFVGVDHAQAVRLAEQYFGDMQSPADTRTKVSGLDGPVPSLSTLASLPSSTIAPALTSAGSSPSSSKLLSKIPFFKNLSTSATNQASAVELQDLQQASLPLASHYTGGFMSLPAIPPPANAALPRVSHIHLAFEALPITSDDIYALAALQILLGGGGSFSAGGPGKGMYSRLYRNVLNQYYWVESCVAFNNSYTDSGLFGISASCSPRMIGQMLDVMCRELNNLTLTSGFSALKADEVARAKNQLKSGLLMNLESRMVELEDLGRQVQIHGRKISVAEMCAKIDALTIDDLRRVANIVVSGLLENPGKGTGKPTVVLQEGDEEGVTRQDLGWEEIQDRIARWKLGRR